MSQQLMKWIKNQAPMSSLYYVVGEEPFFLEEIRSCFLRRVFENPSTMDFNYNDFEASSGKAPELCSLVETLPTLVERRLVFCRNAQNFKEQDWEELLPLVDKPVPTTVLVFFFNDIDGRKKQFKKLKEKAELLPAQVLRDWELDPWIDFLAQKLKITFNFNTKSLFKQLSGASLLDIQNELKKLKTYMGEKQQPEDKDILAVLSRGRMDNVFKLTEAIGKKNLSESLNCLAQLLKSNQNSFGILALIARHMRILSRIHQGQKQGLKNKELQTLAQVSPYFFKDYLTQVSFWTENQIIKTMETLQETDKALKSSPLSAHIWLENFILEVCS